MELFKLIKRYQIVFPLACVVAIGMLLISEASYLHAIDTLEDVKDMATARTSLQNLTKSLLDAETGQRGYLLTHDKTYLQPYNDAAAEVSKAYKFLDPFYDDEPKAKALLTKLHTQISTKLAELATTIRLNDENNTEAAIKVLSSGVGKSTMDEIRVSASELLAYETQKVVQARVDLYQTLMRNRIGIAALTALSLLALFFFLRQSSELDRQQQILKHLVQVERSRLEAEVALQTTELVKLTNHLQTAREDERNRLARDLHDELGALLTAAKLDAARIKSRLGSTMPEAQERLVSLVDALNNGIALKRRIIEDLRPSTLNNLGLVATLEILAHEFTERSGVQVHCTLEPITLKATTELVIYRLVQEAITNITKYAQAHQVWVSLVSKEGEVEVLVRDDGGGFDTITKPISAYGLMGMRFRVEAEGGTLTVLSAKGRGTSIQARLPQLSA